MDCRVQDANGEFRYGTGWAGFFLNPEPGHAMLLYHTLASVVLPRSGGPRSSARSSARGAGQNFVRRTVSSHGPRPILTLAPLMLELFCRPGPGDHVRAASIPLSISSDRDEPPKHRKSLREYCTGVSPVSVR